jgi:hypothetical protein
MVDLMLLHAPGDPQTREETWRALEDAHYEVIIYFQSNHPMSPAMLLAADVRRCWQRAQHYIVTQECQQLCQYISRAS